MLYWIVKKSLRIFLLLYNRFRIGPCQAIAKKGPVIIVSNHISYVDPIYIGVCFPRKIYFMAKKESFRYSVFRWVLNYFGAFPIDRSRPDIRAIKTAIQLLEEGKPLAIFPQGTRKNELTLSDIKQGAAYFAVKTNSPILPLYIKGTEKVMPKGHIWFKPYKVEVFVGEPIEVPAGERMKQSELIEKMTIQVQEAVNKARLIHME